MKVLERNWKRILSIIIVASMVLTSNGMLTLANGADDAKTEVDSEREQAIRDELGIGSNVEVKFSSLEVSTVGASFTSPIATDSEVDDADEEDRININYAEEPENDGGGEDKKENKGTSDAADDTEEVNSNLPEDFIGPIASDSEADDISVNDSAKNEAEEDVIASLSEINETDNEVKAEISSFLDSNLFGADTIYYAIAQNDTTLLTKLYFSSSDLSASTTIGTIKESGTVGTYDNQADRPWRREAYPISGAEILDNIKPTSMKNWFHDVSFVNSITGFDKIDTSAVTDMAGLFGQNFGITSLDLSSWDTSNVTDMSSMFQDCGGLTSLNISNFNTSNVTNMSNMFNNCRSLTSLDVSHFDTSNVTNMGGMFLYCLGLTSLDISNFNTSSVTEMSGMFGNSENVTTITLPATLDTSHVTQMINMFGNCTSLTSIDLSHFNTSNVTSMMMMFKNCSGLTSLDLSTFNTNAVTNMQQMFSGCSGLTTLDLSTFNTNAVTNMNSMFSGCIGIDTITVSSDFVTTNVTDSTDMFKDCTSLEGSQGTTLSSVGDVTDKTYARIDGGTTAPGLFSGTAPTPSGSTVYYAVTGDGALVPYKLYFSSSDLSSDTSHGTIAASGTVGTYASADDLPWKSYSINNLEILDDIKPTSMAYWFYGYNGETITGLDKIDTSDVTDMTSLFEGKVRKEGYASHYESQLQSLDLSSWDTSKVTSMKSMFTACVKLTTLNISNFNTSAVTDMSNMFDNISFTSLDLSSFNTSNVTNMSYMFYGCYRLTNLNISSFNTSNVTNMSRMFSNCQQITAITIPNTFTTNNVTDMSLMFEGCSQLTNLNISSFNTNSVTNMSNMFAGCSSLTSIDVNGFDTSNAISMAGMFSRCSSLTTLDLSNFNTSNVTIMVAMFMGCSELTTLTLPSTIDTSKVTAMANMFAACKSLTSIDVSRFNTSAVTTMASMFAGCSALTTLDLSSFNTANVTDMSSMFGSALMQGVTPTTYACDHLTTIKVSSDFVTTNVTESTDMFKDCSVLTGNQGSTLASIGDGVVDKTYARLDGGTSAPGLFSDGSAPTPSGSTIYYAIAGTSSNYTLYFSNSDLSTSTTIGTVAASGTVGVYTAGTDRPWYNYNDGSLKTVAVLDTIKPTSMAYWFSGLQSVTTFTGLDKIDTSDVTDMSHLFEATSGFGSLDLSSWDTRNVTNMSYMLYMCRTTSLNINGFDTSNVTDMSSMFSNCSELTEITLPNTFDTSNVTNMAGMFTGCSNLQSINLSNFNTDKVTAMQSMFLYCTSLRSIDISSFNTDRVENMRSMFSWCTNLETITFPTNLYTGNVTTMQRMFAGCAKLTTIDLLRFDTTKVTNMNSMFAGCSALTTLDLSSFNTANVTNMSSMFGTESVGPPMAQTTYACDHLTTIKVSADFVTTNVTDSTDMFTGCSVLTGSQGSTLASIGDGVVDKTYARLDGGASAPGLFSDTLTPYTPPTPSGETVYYAIAGNTATFEYTLYFSSSDLSGDTSHGTVVDSGTVGVYDDAADRPWANFMYGFSGGLVILDTIKPTSMKNWFYNKVELANNITGFNNIDTSAVTDMSNLFRQCFGITSLDLSSWDTSNVTDMSSMFQDCGGLTSLNISSFNTSNVTNMSSMFNNCRSLTSLDVSHFDTSNVTNMYCMFLLCQELTSLDLSSFDTSNVTNMGGMLSNCIKLQTLTMPATFNASNVTEMSAMFFNDSALTSLDLSNFSTSAVTSMDRMFGNCSGLTTLDLSGFSTSAVTNMQGVFSGCSALTTLDLSTFNTNAVTNMNTMFSGCTNLTTIKVSADFVTTNVTDSTDMFANCSVLIGRQGSTLASIGDGIIDKTYARLDGGASAPGLFSDTLTPYTPPTPIEILSISGLPNPSGEGDHIWPVGNVTALDLSHLKINVKNDDDSTSDINYTGNESDFTFDPSALTTTTTSVKVTYKGIEKTIDNIFVYTPTTDGKSITNVTGPNKKVYVTGETFDATGLTITITKFDNTSTTVTYTAGSADFTFTPSTIASGTTSVKVKYGRYDNCTYDIPITVLSKAKSFTINVGGIDKYYDAGETFDTTKFHNLKATVTNEDNSTEEIEYNATNAKYFTFTPALGTVLATTHNKITIGLKGVTLDHAIVVEPEPTTHAQTISSSTPPRKTGYVEDDIFDPTGLVIHVEYPGGISYDIPFNDETKDNFEFDPNPFATPNPEPIPYGTDHVEVKYREATYEIPITLTVKEVTDILEVTGLPGQTATEPALIAEGTTIDLTNLRVKVRYNNGQEETISYNAGSTEVQLLPTGPASTGVTYKIKARTKERDLTHNELFVYTPTDTRSITNVTGPNKKVYVAGEAFDATGLTITITKFDGSTTTVTYTAGSTDFTFTPNPITAGTTIVKVKYGRYDNCEADITGIEVVSKAKSFTINDGGIDKYYDAGETFDTTKFHNLKATVTNEDNSTEEIEYNATNAKYFTFTPALGTTLATTHNKITIGLKGVTLDHTIVVEPEPTVTATSISKNRNPNKINYISGDAFDPTGLIINVVYTGGISRVIEYNDKTKNEFSFTPNPPAETFTYGTNHVVVIYRGATFNLPVTVRKQVGSIAVTNGPTHKEYSKGDKFDPTGLVIIVTYTDSSTEEIPYNNDTASGFTFTPALNQAFEGPNVGQKVRVAFGNSPSVEITDMSPIHGDSIAVVVVNSDGTISVIPELTRDAFEDKLDEAIASGATGFHEYEADGVDDARKKYNKYKEKTMNKQQALDRFDAITSAGLTNTIFIGASYPKPAPQPKPDSSSSGGSSSSSGSSPSVGPMGDLTKDPKYADLLPNINPNQNPNSESPKTTNTSDIKTDTPPISNTVIKWTEDTKTGDWTLTAATDGVTMQALTGFVQVNQMGVALINNIPVVVPVVDTYYLNTKGTMVTGWLNTGDNKTYYFDTAKNSDEGKMAKGWKSIQNNWYYFGQDGALYRSTMTPDGYYVQADGHWAR